MQYRLITSNTIYLYKFVQINVIERADKIRNQLISNETLPSECKQNNCTMQLLYKHGNMQSHILRDALNLTFYLFNILIIFGQKQKAKNVFKI